MRRSIVRNLLIVLTVLWAQGVAFSWTAQTESNLIESHVTVVPATGSHRPLHSVDTSPGPPFYVKPSIEIPNFAAKKDGRGANTFNTNPGGSSDGGGSGGNGPTVLTQDPLLEPFDPTVGTEVLAQFEGAHNTDNPFLLNPPDPVGDIGPNHYVQMTNLVTTMFDRSGNLLRGPELHTDLFAGTGHDCGDPSKANGDPIVLYDEQADRWVLTHFAFSRDPLFNFPVAPFYECVAASTTSDPTGSYYLYAMDFSPFGALHDYPKFGITEDAITMTAHLFSFSLFGGEYEGQFVGAIDKSTLYAGQPTQIVGINMGQFYEGFLPADRDDPTGSATPVPALFATAMSSPNSFDIYRLNHDFVTPGNTTVELVSSISISGFDLDLCGEVRERCIPHPGDGDDLETLSDRLMHRLQIRDFGTYLSMVVALTVDAEAAPPTSVGRAGIRWYEFRSTDGGSSWSLYQEGTHAPDDGLHRWMPSIAMNASGDIGIGYMVASETMPVELRVSGQTAASSGTGTFDADEAICRPGLFGSDWGGRSGDYTATSVDPIADTFWYTGEYGSVGTLAGWGTAVCEFELGGEAANTAPTVTIVEPADGAIFNEGESINFVGDASDTEEAALDSSSLIWYSDNGQIGTGASVVTSTLAVGVHTITAESTDSGGLTGTDQISITVNDPSVGTLHVDAILLGTQNEGRGFKRGVATVTIFDNVGGPVANATVDGRFSGDFNESQSAVTDATGAAVFVTSGNPIKGPEFSFCVDAVTDATLSYDPADNTSASYACGAAPNTPPNVLITAPANGSSFDEHTAISFDATADDAEDGNISTSLVWISDADGQIGTGASFSTSTLSVGTHTITASVEDSGSLSGSDQVVVTVLGGQAGATTMHVDSISTGTVNEGQGRKSGYATVTVHDNLGNPVANALVIGEFSGTFTKTVIFPAAEDVFLTDETGSITYYTDEDPEPYLPPARGGVSVSFCVVGVSVLDPFLIDTPQDDADPNYRCNLQ